MKLDIITPEKTVFTEEIDELIVQTSSGELAILPHHINLLTELTPGEAIVRKNGKDQYIAVNGGFLEVKDNSIRILADYAIHTEEIDYEKVVAAQKRAEEVLKKNREDVSERDMALAQAELRRLILQINASNRKRNSR